MSARPDFEGRTPEGSVAWSLGDVIKSPQGELFEVRKAPERGDPGTILFNWQDKAVAGLQETLEQQGWTYYTKGDEWRR